MHLHNQDREPKHRTWVYQKITMSDLTRELNFAVGGISAAPGPIYPNSVSGIRSKNTPNVYGVPKTISNIQIKIKTANPSQEPSAISKAPYQDLKDINILCAFKIKIESQNLDHGYFKDQ